MKTKEMKGITLIALVITIVVLMILAGVSINTVLGDDGLIKKAKEAAEVMKMTATDLYEMKIIDGVIEEPENYTEKNMRLVMEPLEQIIDAFLVKREHLSKEEIAESRYQRFRSF